MVTILGVTLPTSKKVLYPKETAITRAYVEAVRAGRGDAKRVLKYTGTPTVPKQRAK